MSAKNQKEVSKERDFGFAVPVRTRYAILCSPRSGSTLLSRALFNSQVAGDPVEYLNPLLMKLWRVRFGDSQLDYAELLHKVEQLRTSLNGVFGIQLHHFQFFTVIDASATGDKAAKFLKRFDRFIWMRRKDKLAQAVSYAIAMKTKVWSSEDELDKLPAVDDFNSSDLMRALNFVVNNDLGWSNVVQSLGLQVQTLWYEDLVADYEQSLHSVLRHIGVSPNVLASASFPLGRQSTDLNLKLKRKLVEYLGVDGF